MENAGVHLRHGQESCNHLQNLCNVLRSIVESRGVDKGHHPPVEIEFICKFDLGCTRLQARSDLEIRTTCVIDELK